MISLDQTPRRMELFATASEELLICSNKDTAYVESKAKQKKLSLRTKGAELEWELQYTAEAKDDLFFSFKLVPLHGQNLMRTVSYSLELKIPLGYSKIDPPMSGQLVNKTYRCSSARRNVASFSEHKLGIVIWIRLEGGEVTGSTSSSRLYNKKELADLEIKCGELVIKAHQNVLSVHSDTLRTVFSSPRQCGGSVST